MKPILLLLLLAFVYVSKAQNLTTNYWSYIYSGPFYSWKENGYKKPDTLLKIEKGEKVSALGFYIIGDDDRYVGDLKVTYKGVTGWISSINFNTEEVKKVNIINFKEYSAAKTHLADSSRAIKMIKNDGGTFTIPCKVNGLQLNFIFDTGASDVSISMTEAVFMLKNGYLKETDILGKEYYSFANGEIAEGTVIKISKLEFGSYTLYDVRASISHNLNAPLLLGQSALSKLGKITIDYKTSTLTISDK